MNKHWLVNLKQGEAFSVHDGHDLAQLAVESETVNDSSLLDGIGELFNSARDHSVSFSWDVQHLIFDPKRDPDWSNADTKIWIIKRAGKQQPDERPTNLD